MSSKREKQEALINLSETDVEEEQEITLNPIHQRFVHMYLTGQYPIAKIAQLLEVHPNTIHKWMKREDVKNAIQEFQSGTQDMVSDQLKALTLKAVNKLHALMDSPIDGVALQAVKDVLDRSGHKAKQEIKIDKTVRTFEEKLSDLVNRTIIDADFTTSEE